MAAVPPEPCLPPRAEWKSPADRSPQDRVTVDCVRFSRPASAPDGALRDFDADVGLVEADGVGRSVVGSISGRLGWLAWLPELVDTGTENDLLAATVGTAISVGNRLSAEHHAAIEAVLIVERIWLEPEWRGNGLGRRIAEQLTDLLLLTPETTLVLGVADAHPDTPAATAGSPPVLGPLDPSGEYRDAGFERWPDGTAWFLRPPCCDGVIAEAS